MAYVLIDSFRFGVDRRRPRYAAVPGTLFAGKNVHISRGGDIERAKKFVAQYQLPAGTFGLGQSRALAHQFECGLRCRTGPTAALLETWQLCRSRGRPCHP